MWQQKVLRRPSPDGDQQDLCGPLRSLLRVSEGPEEAVRRSWDHQGVSEGPEETIRRCQKLLQVLISHQDWMESFIVS